MHNCTVYFYSNINPKEIIDEINLIVDGEISDNSIKKENYNIFIEENSDYDKTKQYEFPDGFLYFQYILDIEFKTEKKEIIFIINKILKWFWDNKMSAIATYKYENKLVLNGGYKSKDIPFPKRKKWIFW